MAWLKLNARDWVVPSVSVITMRPMPVNWKIVCVLAKALAHASTVPLQLLVVDHYRTGGDEDLPPYHALPGNPPRSRVNA